MLPNRVIPCLDIDAGRVVKGTEFLDICDIGDPVEMAKHYDAEGADEIVFLDITATSGNHAPTAELIRATAQDVFIPLTVGGGIRSETDVQLLLDSGADKVAGNSAYLREPQLLNRISGLFGSQCTVLAIDAAIDGDRGWEVYAAGGREATGRQAIAWAQEGVARGAGEVLLTSIDRDGTNAGYDLELIKALTDVLDVPVIASGGAGQLEHYSQAIRMAGAQAVLAASQLHSGRTNIATIKEHLAADGIAVRSLPSPAVNILPEAASKERPRIAIADYGIGNRYSVQKALELVGANAVLTDEAKELMEADGLVLPGVGAFGPAMERLQATGLDILIRRVAALGRPVLGICLGEQLLFDGSEEGGWNRGLGLIPGIVQEIELPIRPNIGWRQVSIEEPDPIFTGLADNNYFYHLHQYAAQAVGSGSVLAYSHLPYADDPDYKVPTLVRHGTVYGMQFHPEKSGSAGLRLLKNFVDQCCNNRTKLQ